MARQLTRKELEELIRAQAAGEIPNIQPDSSMRFEGRPQYTPPERVSGTNLFGDLKKVGSSILDFVPEALDKADSLLDLTGKMANKAVSAPLKTFIDNPYKDPFKRMVWEDLLEDEDYRFFPYFPTKGEEKKGIKTRGIGHFGDDPSDAQSGWFNRNTTTPNEAEALFKKDIEDKIKTARNTLTPSVYDGLSEQAKLAVISMVFRGDLLKTHTTTKLIKQGRMKEAAIEFLDNDDYRKGIARNRFEKNARRLQM